MKTIIYLLQVSACTGIFYLFYHAVLRRLTFFTINRWYLLSTLLLSFIIPLVTLPAQQVPEIYIFDQGPFQIVNEVPEPVVTNSSATPTNIYAQPAVQVQQSYDWQSLFPSVYFFVAGILLLNLLASLRVLFIARRAKLILSLGKVKVITATRKIRNSSFFNNIFIDDKDLSPAEMEQLIRHELVHVEQSHSLDKVVVHLVQIVLWFNPFAYMYSQAVEANHEFEVDKRISQDSDREEYVSLLLRLAAPGNMLLANQFSMFPLSGRIAMIFTKPSKNMRKLIYFMILPLIAMSCLAFAKRELKNSDPQKKEYAGQTVAIQITNGEAVEKKEVELKSTRTKEIKSSEIQPVLVMASFQQQDTTGIIVPDSFSPNGDGKDDIFTITVTNSNIKITSLKVFDKSGRMIFETTDNSKSWNGSEYTGLSTFQAEISYPYSTSTNYYWTLEATDISETNYYRTFRKISKRGFVTVVRDGNGIDVPTIRPIPPAR